MTHQYRASVVWERGAAAFTDNKYSRAHLWRFDGGLEVPASSSPAVVRLPYSRADAVDPEEAFVAALASCHMLFFLSLAAREGLVIDSYRDEAVGTMARNAKGKMFVARVALRPAIAMSGAKRPAAGDLERLHHAAHGECFIANSVLTEVAVEPEPVVFAPG